MPTVAGPPDGFGGDDIKPVDAHRIGDGAEAMNRPDRTGHRSRHQLSGTVQAGPQRAQRFLVEAGQGSAAQTIVDHQADGVGPDIDHAVMGEISRQIPRANHGDFLFKINERFVNAFSASQGGECVRQLRGVAQL